MGKLDMKLMQGIEETEKQIQKDKQSDSNQGKLLAKGGDTNKSHESSQKPQKTLKQSKLRKNTKNSKKDENGLNTKPQKQVFSFRAVVSDILIWKAYATAAGKTMENIGTVAMNEYMKRHKLNEAEQAVFEALKAREENRK